MRRLWFELLERRDLMSADLTWPDGVGFSADFFNHAGAGMSSRKFGPAQAFIGASSIDLITSSVSSTRSTIAGSSSDLNGAFFFPDGQNRVAAVYVQGGLGSSSPGLETSIKNAFRKFVDQGGSYFGSCRGAYFAEIYFGIRMNVGGGSGYQTFVMPEGHPIADYLVANGVTDRTVHSVRFYSGPIFSASRTQPPDTNLVGKVISGKYVGTAEIIERQYGEGWVSVVPNHPEYKGRLSNGKPSTGMLFAAGWLKDAIDRGQQAPDVKGELAYGQSVSMVDITEKIGDGQYHRYLLGVTPETRELRLSTDNIIGTELFVTYNGVAYNGGADYSGDTIIISSPEPGEWEVSVLGTHNIKNGVNYTLTVDAVIGPPPTWFEVPFDPQKPYQNPINRFDVNGDGEVTPLDAMLLINAINEGRMGQLPEITAWPKECVDVTGDGTLSLFDVLDLLNEIF